MAKVADRFQILKLLSKSGIVSLVLISVLGGYAIARPPELAFDFLRLGLTLLGILFLSSGSSALNQVQDAQMDAQMERTRKRPLPAGQISRTHALLFACGMMAVGGAMLGWLDLRLLAMGAAAVVSYNGFYTLWWKRHHAWGAVPGAIPGALPIWMGVVAAQPLSSVFSPEGIYLFAILFFWQMPHFWSLAIRYHEDYRKGGVPTLPVVHGVPLTVRQIAIWTVAYCVLIVGAPLFLSVGRIYAVIAWPLCGVLLFELIRFARTSTEQARTKSWLRFFLWVTLSLIVVLGALAMDLWSVYPQAWWQSR